MTGPEWMVRQLPKKPGWFRAYYRRSTADRWHVVLNQGGYPIVYTTREAARTAAIRVLMDD